MDLPASRKREFHEKEVSFIQDAIRASGLDPASIDLAWDSHAVTLNGVVEIQAVLFDCRGLLDTPCWSVHRFVAADAAQPCSCGALVRESADGTYGSLRAAIAAALAETVRSRVLANLTDSSEPILKERPGSPDALPPTSENDFITHCVHP
jgi:hypothetical protein